MSLDRSIAPKVFPLNVPELPGFEHYRLPNGMRVTLLRHGCDAEVFRLSVIRPGGQACADIFGEAGLYVSMLQEGTMSRTSAEIADTLDGCGAWLGSDWSVYHFINHLSGLNSSANEVIDVLADIVANPVFPEDILEIRREAMAQKVEVNLRKVLTMANQAINQVVWGKNNHNSRLMDPEAVRKIDADTLSKLHSSIYNPSDIHLFLSGNITPEIEQYIHDSFGSIKLPEGVKAGSFIILPKPPVSSCGDVTINVTADNSKQAAIRLDIPVIGRDHPDYEKLRLTMTALGGYFGSRLMTNLREERGLTYGISAALMGSIDGGVASIFTECRSDAVDEAVSEIRSEIKRMSSDPLTIEELQRLKGFALSRQASTLDSPFSIIEVEINKEILRTPDDYFNRTTNSITSATPESICDMAEKYLDLSKSATAIAK